MRVSRRRRTDDPAAEAVPMTWYAWIAVFFFGAVWGSFFCTLALRFIDGSFDRNAAAALFTPSRCPHCGSRISPAHLVPLIGYLLLRGRCGRCGKKISYLYPSFEIICGTLLVAAVANGGIGIFPFVMYLIMCVAITISLIDLKTLTIPNTLVAACALLSIYPVLHTTSLKSGLLGAAGMFCFFVLILLLFPGSFGGGDAKFATAIGLLCGIEMSIVVMETALVTGSIAGIVYAWIMKKGLTTRIPFAPFLTAGLIAAHFFGRDIILLYHRITCR